MFSLKSRSQIQIDSLRHDINLLTMQMNEIARRMGALPQPARANWQRHSLPIFDTNPSSETVMVPVVKTSTTAIVPAVRPALSVLPRRIMRVTFCSSGEQQWVTSYDANGEKIPEYCGSFRSVGRKILEREPNLQWQQVAESA